MVFRMKKTIQAVGSFFVVVALIAAGLLYLADLTERKESINKFGEFYEQKEDFDVLFVGQSHVLNGIFPMELWNDYGIVSYNLAGHGNRPATTYWVMKNALQHTNPKLVVFDCGMIGKDEKIGPIEQLHISTDSIPYSNTKVEMIHDLIENEKQREEFLWNFSTYHNRWNEIEKNDFVPQYSVEKGAESRIDVAVPDEMVYFEDSLDLEEETLGMEYTRRIIEDCQKAGIEVLLTYLPFPDKTGWQLEANSVYDIAEEYGVNYLDFYTLLEQVNLNTDFYDVDSHMNPSGARKITNYIGNYIMENYSIEDQRENEVYSSWHEDYEDYTEFKKENIRKEEELKNYLMLLNDKNISFGIYIKPWNMIGNYPVLMELLSNIGIDYSQIPNEDYFLLVDRVGNERKEMRLFETMESRFAEFTMFYNDDGQLEFTNSEADSMIITRSDIAIVVFDNSDLSFIDQANFVLKDMPMEFGENTQD